jgi:cell wall-associated NlpC family hydrolase
MTRHWLEPFDRADRRLNAHRDDIETGLAEPAFVAVPVADIRPRPDADCPIDCQALLGAALERMARRDGWSWIRVIADGYVGWARDADLSSGVARPTHVVQAARAPVFPGPDMKLPVRRILSMGSKVEVVGEVVTRDTRYHVLASGEGIAATQLRPVASFDADPVAVARRLLATPYVWGGSSAFGIDCSGLVQLAYAMCGSRVLRDSDMQTATLGARIDPGPDLGALRRGDLVFWRGHAAMVEGGGNLLHANGFTMDVVSEPLGPALARIAKTYSPPVCFRRP